MNATTQPTPTSQDLALPRMGALVLAAGAGRRMGHRPKCLLQLNGRSLIDRQLEAVHQAGLASVLVVLGHHAERIQQQAALQHWGARWVVNPQPDAGHVSSLRAGLQALPPGLAAVMVLLADQPMVDVTAIQALMNAYAARPEGTHMVQPTVQDLPGNPVVFSSAVALQILAGGVQMGVRQWQQLNPEKTYRWKTPDARYRLDVDNEQDLQTLETLTGHRLLWPSDLSRQNITPA
ncbi:nucleotidyltransferase family protein [Limnohabitans sp.]|uniref:nucleotidyltransferase family protein n=1 Tax=Limnohabitans sp. TaxID=1907725 RepID=UPI0039BC6398|nr:nucleotidyltransferase family protein [Comamonadaceae bacterium]